MIALRDSNAAVNFVDRNVAEGCGDETAFTDAENGIALAPLDTVDTRRRVC